MYVWLFLLLAIIFACTCRALGPLRAPIWCTPALALVLTAGPRPRAFNYGLLKDRPAYMRFCDLRPER